MQYKHAHKLHHFLHGTNAFDAHIYGSGMPEEFFMLALELGMYFGFGLIPASLNAHGTYRTVRTTYRVRTRAAPAAVSSPTTTIATSLLYNSCNVGSVLLL